MGELLLGGPKGGRSTGCAIILLYNYFGTLTSRRLLYRGWRLKRCSRKEG